MREQVNGVYSLYLHSSDPRASNSLKIKLGSFNVNFMEGSSEGNNLRVRDDYRLFDIINNYFPPEEPEKGAAVPLAFCGVLLAFFGRFLG